MTTIPSPIVPTMRVPPKAKSKEPRKKTRKPANQFPNHAMFLLYCNNIGGDLTAKTRYDVKAVSIQSALRIRVDFYGWRRAIREEMGEEFALDNKLADVKVHIHPPLNEKGEVMRNERNQPLYTNMITFYSQRATPETEALIAAFGQVGVGLGATDGQ